MNSKLQIIRKGIFWMFVLTLQSSWLYTSFGEDMPSRQVFLDGRFIQDPIGVELVVNQPRLDREQLIVSEHPWEDQMIGAYTSVIQEGDQIKLWYEARDQAGTWSMAYAYSDDGGNSFVKPNLGVIDYQGSTANNLVLTGGLGHTVFLMGPEAPASEKYGCLRHVDGGWPDYTPDTNRLFVSPDGLNWTPKGIVPFLYEGGIQPTDSQNVTFWDTRLEKYVCYPRLFASSLGGRAVGRYEGDTLESFPREPSPVVLQTDPDADNHELYTSAIVQYPYADDAYYAFPAMFAGGSSYVYVRFNASRDGIDWPRTGDMPVVIAEGFNHDGNTIPMEDGSIYAGYGLTRQGDEVSLYYTTLPGGHVYPPPPNSGIITRATYRLDGFMSVDAGVTSGQFTTPVMQLDSDQLAINFKGEAGGWVDVEILDGYGNPLPGYGSAQVDRSTGDSVSMPLGWNGSTDVSSLRDTPVKLRFTMSDGKLYGFQGASEYEDELPQLPKIIAHEGLNDPTGEGWTLLGIGTYTVGPGANDGQDYWPIDASGQEAGKYVGYRIDDTQDFFDILTDPNGWVMSATVKVTNPSPNIHVNEPFFGVRDPSTWWQLSMTDTGIEATTGVYIQDTSGAEVLVEAVDISAYHTYKMVYDPVADSIDVTVDGGLATTFARADVLAVSGFSQINFGDFNSTAGGSISYWNAVEFSERGLGGELPGDANGDGSVDVSDLGILATNYGTIGGMVWADADFTADGNVDVSDLGILATNYGTTSASAVPEPSSVVLLLGVLSASLLWRRRSY